jgi:hypothetical protein
MAEGVLDTSAFVDLLGNSERTGVRDRSAGHSPHAPGPRAAPMVDVVVPEPLV